MVISEERNFNWIEYWDLMMGFDGRIKGRDFVIELRIFKNISRLPDAVIGLIYRLGD